MKWFLRLDGKDTSIYFKISSPARFYNICSNHYLKHCTNLHILYCYPERVFFPPESSSFSEGNRLGNSPSNQPSQAQICTCEKQPLRFLSVLLVKLLFTTLAIHVFRTARASPPARSPIRQRASLRNLWTWSNRRSACARAATHLL